MDYSIDTRQLDALRRSYARFSDRRFNAGLATALTKTAQAVRTAQVAEMRDVFDRPTPRTLGAVFVSPASAARLEARVGVADNPFSQGGAGRAPIKYLRWQIGGGARTLKAFERRLVSAGAMPDDMRAVPGRGARLDAFGNISGGQLRQMFSQLRIELSSGAKSTLTRITPADDAKAKRLKGNTIRRAYGRAGGRYIALPRGRGKLKPGVYFNSGRDFGAKVGYGSTRSMQPVLLFVRSASYEAGRYDFHYVSQLALQRNLGPNVDAALADQLRRWAQKYGG